MAENYDRRRTAAKVEDDREPHEGYDTHKLIASAEEAEREFKAGVALIQKSYDALRAVRNECSGQLSKIPQWQRGHRPGTGSKPAQAFSAIYDYAEHVLEDLDESKILKKTNWTFEEFVSETKANLKDL